MTGETENLNSAATYGLSHKNAIKNLRAKLRGGPLFYGVSESLSDSGDPLKALLTDGIVSYSHTTCSSSQTRIFSTGD